MRERYKKEYAPSAEDARRKKKKRRKTKMKNLKKIALAALVITALLMTALTPAFAAVNAVVYVSIANGELVLANAPVVLTDADEDGSLTINDALLLAHEKYYTDGASGFDSETTNLGISLKKLWGVDNGGSYGYYVNNASPMSLSDEVKGGDCVYAFVYTDTVGWSDTFCYFDKTIVEAAPGEQIELALFEIGFDLNWNTVAIPLEGATVTVDGTPVNAVTDADGKITVTVGDEGTHLISASKDGRNLVPPVCSVTVTEPTETGDVSAVILVLAVIASAVLFTASFKMRRKAVR